MKKYSLSFDDEDFADITIGVLEVAYSYSDHEFFYHLNTIKSYHFKRDKDFIFEGKFHTYYHSVFKGYHEETKTSITFISNQSYHYKVKNAITELFAEEESIHFLLKKDPFKGFLIKTSPLNSDFSLILYPEDLFPIKTLQLNKSQDIYHLIESYE